MAFFPLEDFSVGSYMKGCSHKVDSCPQGHELLPCIENEEKDSFFCKQCSDITFQPNENRGGDRCRLRKVCSKPYMEYKDPGSTTEDAQCKCRDGFHFESTDQRACVPNSECDKGFGQGEYGQCVKCINIGMYSDARDRLQKCKVLTNCRKKGRCIIKKSNGTFDNTCGRQVDDLSKCSELPPDVSGDTHDQAGTVGVIVGCVFGAAIVLILVLLLIFCLRRRHTKKLKQRAPSKEQLKEMLHDIIVKSEKDEVFCKKVLSCYFHDIEDKIDRQIWKLAQELYKEHYQTAQYEIIVEKYKDNDPKFAVNGYLQEWRKWRGETAQAVEELSNCLKQCGREDIAYGICSNFQDDDAVVDGNSAKISKHSKKSNFCEQFMRSLFPCSKKKQESQNESKETTSKLLEIQSQDAELGHKEAGKLYRDRPCPSAPVFDEHHEVPSNMEVHYSKRAMSCDSYPVQVCS